MYEFYKFTIILFVSFAISLIPVFSFGVSDEAIVVNDKANIIDSENESNINGLISKLKYQTVTPFYILTVKSSQGEYNEEVEKILENKKKLNAIILIYYAKDGGIDIKTGSKISETLTSTFVDTIKDDSDIIKTLDKNPSEGIEYLSTALADRVFVANGYDSILDVYISKKENVKSDKWFFIGLVVISLLVFFITPKSPSQKLKEKNDTKYNFTKGFGKF